MITTDYQRTEDTLAYYMHGLYSLDQSKPLSPKYEIDYREQLYSPIEGTLYEKMIANTFEQKCPHSPILRIPTQFDELLSTKSCPVLFKFLAYDQFNMEKVLDDIKRDIPESYRYTKSHIESLF